MRTIPNRKSTIAVLAAVALVTGALGVAASAHMARAGQYAAQGPGGQGGPPPGMMGQGRGGPGGPGWPGGRGGGPGGGIFGMIGPELQALNLTDAQQKQVQAILESYKSEQHSIRDRMQAARKALNDAVAADTIDEAVIRAKAADQAAVEADSAVLQAKVRAAVYGLLTPEQTQKAKELRNRMQNRPLQGPGRIEPLDEPQGSPDEAGVSLPETV
jgi:Spy/CpxP family protein refolding chaperone